MSDMRDDELLQQFLTRYNFLINRPFLQELTLYPVAPPCLAAPVIRLIMIKVLSAVSSPSTFEFIFNALASLKQSIGYLLDFSTNTFIIGIQGDCPSALPILRDGLMASFPNSIIEEVPSSSDMLRSLFSPSLYTQLAAVTVIPNTSLSTSLMSSFTKLMGNALYTAFFLASPFPRDKLQDYHDELCELYENLSAFSQTGKIHLSGISKNSSMTIIKGDTITHGNSATRTLGSNITNTTAGYTNSTISSSGPVPALNNQNVTLTYLLNKAAGRNRGSSDTNAEGNTYSHANLNNTNTLSAENRVTNNTTNYSIQNKCVQNALLVLSDIISRIDTLLQSFCVQYGAYFFSSAPETTIRAAYSFLGLAPDNDTYLGASAVNLFNPDLPNYEAIYNSLAHFEHPRFTFPYGSNLPASTTFISGSELLNSFYFPIS